MFLQPRPEVTTFVFVVIVDDAFFTTSVCSDESVFVKANTLFGASSSGVSTTSLPVVGSTSRNELRDEEASSLLLLEYVLSLQDDASDAIDMEDDFLERAGLDEDLEDFSLEIRAERTDSGRELHASSTDGGSGSPDFS